MPGGDAEAALVVLDASRESYRAYYTEIESIAQSSLHALRPAGGGRGASTSGASGGGSGASGHGGGADAAIRLVERYVPRGALRKVPPVWRARAMRAANKAAGLRRR